MSRIQPIDRPIASRLVPAGPAENRDEVWEGVRVVSPLADFEHQILVSRLIWALTEILGDANGDVALPGCNVSDREVDWTSNYRIPDVAVYLDGGVGRILGSHSVAGPDFLVEILSADDPAPEKLGFYAKVGVREALYIHRDPWALELHRRAGDSLALVERSTIDEPRSLESDVLLAGFRLVPGVRGDRPRIEVESRREPAAVFSV